MNDLENSNILSNGKDIPKATILGKDTDQIHAPDLIKLYHQHTLSKG